MKAKKCGLAIIHRNEKASLTVEASLVLPVFLYFIIAFLYIIQVVSLQEQIQTSITKMSMSLSKTAYLYKDFADMGEALNFDDTIFDGEYDFGLRELADTVAQGALVKVYAGKFLNEKQINISLIRNGFDGISFYGSKVLDEENCIDIIVRYRVRLPIKIFVLEDMRLTQRVKVRAWTGLEVSPRYSVEEGTDNIQDMVYITETGSVYHTNKNCSHIKLSVRPVKGIPDNLKNNSGSKYDACDKCCKGIKDILGTYYITLEGTKYHTLSDCSFIKRSVKEIDISEVEGRLLCKRCSK